MPRLWLVAASVAIVTLLCTAAVAVALPRGGSPADEAAAPVVKVRPFRGLGSWVDMYAWSNTFTGGKPTFSLPDVDAMARAGIQTLYIQAASQTGSAAVLEPERLGPLITRAHQLKLSVVVWYLPVLANVADDMARLLAISKLPTEGVAVDVESIDVANVAQRNAALVSLSVQMRAMLPGRPLGAVVMPPTLLEAINPHFWPDFPWRAIAGMYDAWLPMAYWTMRSPASGLADGFNYTADNLRRLRIDLGLASPEIAPIGGDAAAIGPDGVDRFVAAIHQGGGTGGSLYEWSGTQPAVLAHLAPLRN